MIPTMNLGRARARECLKLCRAGENPRGADVLAVALMLGFPASEIEAGSQCSWLLAAESYLEALVQHLSGASAQLEAAGLLKNAGYGKPEALANGVHVISALRRHAFAEKLRSPARTQVEEDI